MIRPKPQQPLALQAKSRVLAWLAREVTTSALRTKIAEAAKVNEKTLRLAVEGEWDPRVSTLEKLEGVMPPDWQPEGRSRKAA